VRQGVGRLQWPTAMQIKVFCFEKGNRGIDASIQERKGSGLNDACPAMNRRWPAVAYRQRTSGITSGGGCCSKKKIAKTYLGDYAFGHDKSRTPWAPLLAWLEWHGLPRLRLAWR
jgi:hypothetical protein